MGEGYKWTLTVESRRKGGPGSGHHGHAGRPGQRGGSAPGKGGGGGRGYSGQIQFGTTRGTASATTHPDGTVVVRREDYAQMSPDDRRWLIGHEVVHATVDDYHEKHPDEWDDSKRLLHREVIKHGRWEGFDAFYPWTINLSEAIADALTGHLLGRDEFSNMPTGQWREFRRWASGLVKRAGYSEDVLRGDIDRIYGQLNAELEG